MSDADTKIATLVDAQIKNEERFAALADSHAHTDQRLNVLIDIVSQRRNGDT